MAVIRNGMTALLLAVIVIGMVEAAPTGETLTVRIIHTNDMHSRFEETSQLSGICSEKEAEDGHCYGGFARLATLIRQVRNSSTENLPTFFLNAGDTYQGTKLFSYYKWRIVAKFLNILRPDVASLGNHEFDDGVKGLVPFLNNITFPVVAANLDLSSEPTLQQANQLKKSTILYAKNRKIGVIGYLTPETKQLSQPGEVKFLDEVISIREEAKKLKAQDCDIIIALGHSGYIMDMKIAREVEDVDLVIGGHTNTFLYNGVKPDEEKPEGLYPTEVVQPSGRKVYVVQAYAYTKYLGDLSIDFDAKGEITRIEGKPILVNSSIPKAEDVEVEVKIWSEPVANLTKEVVGSTKVLLQGDEKVCRYQECNFGNLVTDAMIYHNIKNTAVDNGWTDTAIAIHQAGGIRSSVGAINDDKVTMDDILTAFPFGTHVYKVEMGARTLWEALEWSVHDRITQNTTSHGGAFLHYSGLQVTYDLSKQLKSRVVSVKVRCSLCIVPSFRDLDMDATYSVLVPSFLYTGGDGFDFLKHLEYKNLNVTVADVVREYINQTSPVWPGVEGRIKFILNGQSHDPLQISGDKSPNSAGYTHISPSVIILALLSSFALLRLL